MDNPSISLPPPPLPPVANLPPPPLMRGPPPRIPFTNTILLSNLPSFLLSFQQLRDWVFPCGNLRNVIFYPKPTDDETTTEESSSSTSPSPSTTTALLTFSHPDGACQFLASFTKDFFPKLDERYQQLSAYMVPAAANLPLPPPFVVETVGDKLWQNWIQLEQGDDHDLMNKTQVDNTTNNLSSPSGAAAAAKTNNDEEDDDEEEDPLTTPQVLAAVKEFRRKLDQNQGYQQKRRIELVAKKLAEMRPLVQARMQEERAQAAAAPPPPPPPALPLPPQGGLLPPPPLPPSLPAGDSGKRGRSNLPAWMTQQQQQQQQQEEGEPPLKKQQRQATHFPPLPPEAHAPLRAYLDQQLQQANAADETLLDFLVQHVTQQKATAELEQELQGLLEDEAPAFLQGLWEHVDRLVAGG